MKKQTRFSEMLAEVRGGVIDAELSAMLAEVGRSIREAGGKGSITIKVTIAANGDGSAKFDFGISHKVPSPSLGTAVMFMDEQGNFTRTDQRQLQMFRDPSAPTIESRAYDPGEVAVSA